MPTRSHAHAHVHGHSHARALDPTKATIYLVGGGVASLASAALFIRDGGIGGSSIHIFEQSAVVGGYPPPQRSAESGCALRGGRAFDEHSDRMFELLRSIPSLSDPAKSVCDDVFHARYNAIVRPMVAWLRQQGVHLDTNVTTTQVDFRSDDTGRGVERLHLMRKGKPCTITVFEGDAVIVTVGATALALPEEGRNFASIDERREVPGDCVFTVAHSVRAAHTAVSRLLG